VRQADAVQVKQAVGQGEHELPVK